MVHWSYIPAAACGSTKEVNRLHLKSISHPHGTLVQGVQDFSQLTREYGDQESKVIQNICGNIISGAVLGDTARLLSERFGRIVQQRQSINITREDKSTGITTQLDTMIPAAKISNLRPGEFVGSVADNFGDHIEQKIFHAQITVEDTTQDKDLRPIPILTDFTDADGADHMEQIIHENYERAERRSAAGSGKPAAVRPA